MTTTQTPVIRWIPQGMTQYAPEIGDYKKDLFAVYVDMAKLTAIFYKGRSTKHVFYNRFQNVEQMKNRINTEIKALMTWEDTKVASKAKRSQAHTLKVGDVLYSSWGYDQTNINFYQVTRIVGKQSVEVREINSESKPEDGFMTAEKRAIKGAFYENEKPRVCRVNGENNTIRLSSYEYAYPDDGRFHRYSWYA